MQTFRYIATNSKGESVQANVEAENKDAAIEALLKQSLHVISVQPANKKGELKLGSRGKVKAKEIVIFSRQLATLVNAGVPLVRSLNTLQVQSENKFFKKELSSIVKRVEAGSSLADALEEHPKIFSPIYINMVRAGEEGGILDDVLKRLAVQQEKDAAIRAKIKSAMTYPGVILTITIVAFFVLMTTIVPKIGDLVKSISEGRATLPIYTVILLKISDVMKTPLFIISTIVLTPLVFYFFRRYIKTKQGQYLWHKTLLKVPIVKTLIGKVAIARFARTFSALMGAGVPIIKAIDTTAAAVGNAVIEKELHDAAHAVQAGRQFSQELEDSPNFPPLVSQMLAVGEETGQVQDILVKVAEFYEEEVDAFVGALSSIIEPVMIVVLGGIVGLIAASVMGPLSSLTQSI